MGVMHEAMGGSLFFTHHSSRPDPGRRRACPGVEEGSRNFGAPACERLRALNFFCSDDPILQFLAPLEASQVFEEVLHESVELVVGAAGGVGGDVAVGEGPERVVL